MIKAIKNMKNDVIKFTQDLIRIPSPVGKEGKFAQGVFDKLKEFSLDDVFIDGIGNVIGVLRGEGMGPNILLNTHMDTVPPGDINNWNGYDPFGAEIDQEGYIHGLGAADDKGGLSVQLYLMKLLFTFFIDFLRNKIVLRISLFRRYFGKFCINVFIAFRK